MNTIAQTLEKTESSADSILAPWAKQNIFIKVGICVAVVIIMVVLLKLVAYLFKKLDKKVSTEGEKFFKPIVIRKFQLLGTDQILKAVLFLLKIVRYVVYIIIGYLTLITAFALFEQTKNIAFTLLGYILEPLKNTGIGIIKYIPNLIKIVVTFVISHYFIRLTRFFTTQIGNGKLVLPGFYAEWAQPTFNILRVLIYAFTLVIIYPMLPNSGSDVFKGVSVFVGILFSLGSSSVVSNLVAGLVLTYMRPFNMGDRIKIGDTVGFVVERSATVTRIRTHKNEYVTFPNSTILTANITNYTFATEKENETDRGIILYTDITFGYHTPCDLIEKLLLEAAAKTSRVLEDPKPYVLQTRLDDFYAAYQINVYVLEYEKIPAIYSELHRNIQHTFAAAGLDMTAPHYRTGMPFDESAAIAEAKSGKFA